MRDVAWPLVLRPVVIFFFFDMRNLSYHHDGKVLAPLLVPRYQPTDYLHYSCIRHCCHAVASVYRLPNKRMYRVLVITAISLGSISCLEVNGPQSHEESKCTCNGPRRKVGKGCSHRSWPFIFQKHNLGFSRESRLLSSPPPKAFLSHSCIHLLPGIHSINSIFYFCQHDSRHRHILLF